MSELCSAAGNWGSGKTRGACVAFLLNCLANPKTAAYGASAPFSMIIGLTRDVLRDSAHAELLRVCPSELIIKESKQPWEITLANHHKIVFRSVSGRVDGGSACGVFLDEAHRLPTAEPFLNYQARARDPLARRRVVLVAGLPVDGWLKETFEGEGHADDPERLIVFCDTEENPHLPPETVRQLKRSASAKTADRYLRGRWQTPERNVFFEFSPARHVVRSPAINGAPFHLAIDIGEKSCVLWIQERPFFVDAQGRRQPGKSLHVLDEWLPSRQSTAQIMRAVADRRWPISESSLILIDPTARSDEINAIRDVFARNSIIRKKRGKDQSEAREYGYAAVNAALSDADGNTRLTFDSSLPRTGEHARMGVISAMGAIHRRPDGSVRRDNYSDHATDAVRYAVAHLLPIGRAGHTLTR